MTDEPERTIDTYTAAGPQTAGCGHDLAAGERLHVARVNGNAVGTCCSRCLPAPEPQ